MNLVYTIENTFDNGYPCVQISTVFATDNPEVAKERFEYYRKCCEAKANRSNNEYILYQWDENRCKILDRYDDYEEETNYGVC